MILLSLLYNVYASLCDQIPRALEFLYIIEEQQQLF